MAKLEPGDRAPDFALSDQRDKTVELEDFRPAEQKKSDDKYGLGFPLLANAFYKVSPKDTVPKVSAALEA